MAAIQQRSRLLPECVWWGQVWSGRILIAASSQSQNASQPTCNQRRGNNKRFLPPDLCRPQYYYTKTLLFAQEGKKKHRRTLGNFVSRLRAGKETFKNKLKVRWSKLTITWQHNFNKFFFSPGAEIHQIMAWSNREMIRKETNVET